MPEQVKDDEDFETPVKPAKPAIGAGRAQAQAQGEVPEPVAALKEETPTEQPVKPRFPARMLREAEEYGFTPEELGEIESAADLRSLLEYERGKQHARRESQMGRVAQGRDGSPAGSQPTPPAPPVETPPPEDEWNFESDLSDYDEKLQKELKRIGKLARKTEKGASKDEFAELKKQLEEVSTTLQALQAANHPAVIRAEQIARSYSKLFGAGKDADPKSYEAFRYRQLIEFINGPLAESGKATGIPEKDIPAVIAILWPGSQPDGAQETPDPSPAPAPKKVVAPPPTTQNRIAEWNEAGQAPSTGRNGAERTGIPSEKDAKKVIRNGLTKMKLPTDTHDDSEDDLEDF